MKSLINAKDKDYLKRIKAEDIDKIKDFRKLKAYNLSIELLNACLLIINSLPICEEEILKKQLRGSIQGVVAQIAEGNGQLYTKKHIQFMSFALGSLSETQAHLDIALSCGYISKAKHEELDSIAMQIRKLLIAYIKIMLKELNVGD